MDNPFAGLHTFADYQQLQQQHDLARAVQMQAMQTGSIDALTKQNALATQLISAASAPAGVDAQGNAVYTPDNQAAYDAAKQRLHGLGIDVSTYAPDVQTGAQQVAAARQASSPYGTLFNAQQKVIGNNIAAAGLGLPNGGMIQPVPVLPGQQKPPVIGGANPPSAGMLPPTTDFKQAAANPPDMPNNTTAQNYGAPVQVTDRPVPTAGQGGMDDLLANAAQPPATQTPEQANPLKFSFRPQASGETLAAYKAAQQQAFDEFKLANTADIKKAEKVGETAGGHVEAALGGKDILRLYNKIGNEAGKVPGGMIQNAGANVANALNIPSDAANARGTFDADLNNLYLATIRSMASTGRVMKAEIEKIGEAAPQQNDPTGVKISKVNAHLEDYNQRMKDMGFNPSTGKELAKGETPQDVPKVPMPGKEGSLPTIASPQDPAFQQLAPGAQFIGPDGVTRTKH